MVAGGNRLSLTVAVAKTRGSLAVDEVYPPRIFSEKGGMPSEKYVIKRRDGKRILSCVDSLSCCTDVLDNAECGGGEYNRNRKL